MKFYFITSILFFNSLLSCNTITKDKAIETEKKRPNVIFILADDFGYNDVSYMGTKYYETPNIDKLSRESIIFTEGYATGQVCSPSRASIMTGKFTARHGITDWIGAATGEKWANYKKNTTKLLPPDYVRGLPKQDITIAEAMKSSGYKTFFTGKWHLGDKGSYPEDHGFEINKGGWDKGSPNGGYFSPWVNPSLENKLKGENLSMRLAKETVSFIEHHKDSSFFAFLSFYAVHGPIQTTEDKWTKYRDKAEENGIADNGYKMERRLPIRQTQDNPIYAGLVESMDDAIGHVLKSLKALGLDKNTIIVFTSDNGGVASGDNYSTSNLPLRGGKGYQWEGGIREPYLIKVPWLETVGKKSSYPVTGADFYPTILDLTNQTLIPEQHIDGISLKPILEGKTVSERPLYWHYPHYGNQGGDPTSIIRENKWKLIYYWEDGKTELYNLETDLEEQFDISSKNKDKTEELNNKLHAWLTKVNANKPIRNEKYNDKRAKEVQLKIKNKFLPSLEIERKKILSKNFEPNKDWWGSKTID